MQLQWIALAFMGAIAASRGVAAAQEASSLPSARESLNDAWFTGPMLAASAATLPRGHVLIEPYVYDVTAPHSNGFGSFTYALYGLTDRLTVGIVPVLGYNAVSNGLSSSGIGLGDATLEAQYGLTRFHEGSALPAAAVNIQETFPTGQYDRLGDRPTNGLGAGAYATTASLYLQSYFWLRNGRILRTRLDLSETFSSDVHLEGVSVYGTGGAFHGVAQPGNSTYADAAFEYSATRNWVAALDVTYRVSGSTFLVDGSNRQDLGSSEAIAFAPAIEYNWTPRVGLLFGTRIVAMAHNTTKTITPAAAINIVI
jgi:hypothetical protein